MTVRKIDGLTIDADTVDGKDIVFKVAKTTVHYDDTSPVTLVTVPAGSLVLAVMVEITTVFSHDSAISGIGDASDYDGFLPLATINADTLGWKPTVYSELGEYLYEGTNKFHPKFYATETAVTITLLANGFTQGVADVYVVYVSLA